MDTITPAKSNPPFRRKNSTVIFQSKLNISTAVTSSSPSTSRTTSSSSSSQSFYDIIETITIPTTPYYTSLKDLIPSSAAVQSPTSAAAGASSGYEIPIRNRLVKQAAWAYLQPMSSSPYSDGRSFIRRVWIDVLNSRIGACFGHVFVVLRRALDGMMRTILQGRWR